MTELGTSIAELLAGALRTGTPLDLIPQTPLPPGGVLDEEEMRGWDDGHDIDAALLRDLLHRGLGNTEPDPRGLRLRGARIRGRLDLDHVDTSVVLGLFDCLLDHGVTTGQARLPVLGLYRCRLSHSDEPAFFGDGLRVEGRLELASSVITGENEEGAVRLVAARIGGQLNLRGTALRNPSGPALLADGLRTGSDAFLDEGFTAEGTVRFPAARIGGQLNMRGAVLRNTSGPALLADGLQSGSDAVFIEGFEAEGSGHEGAIRLPYAKIGGQLSLRGATLRNASGPALHADGLQTDSNAFLDEGFTAEGAVRLPYAKIGGQLSLRGATLRNASGPALHADGLTSSDAFLDEGFEAEGSGHEGTVRLLAAQVGDQLSLSGATLRNSSGPALVADRLQTGGNAYLDEGFKAEGPVRLPSAKIGQHLRLNGADLCNSTGPALVADGLQTGGDAFLDEGFKAEGTVRFLAARIGGQLSLNGAALRNGSGPALHADRLQTGGNAFLNEGFTAEGSGDRGAVSLHGAKIGGQFNMRGADLHNSSGPALHADGLQTGSDAIFDVGFEAKGEIRLPGAKIGQDLCLNGANLCNSSGPALHADGLQTGGNAFLDGDFKAKGSGHKGTVRLLAARIGGQLSLRGADLRNASGPALHADGLHTAGSTFLNERFTAEGTGHKGTVSLAGARIGDQLTLRGADMRNSSGPALVADSLQTDGSAMLDDGLKAKGSGHEGTVRLPAARIGGQLSLRGATLRNASGPALLADELQTATDAFLDEGFEAEGLVRLPAARIDGHLSLANGEMVHQWEIDGLTYLGVPRFAGTANREAWLQLLRANTPGYAAQPYQQLAAAYRAEGHDSDVRRILMKQRTDQIARGGLNWADRSWARATGWLLGYGYQPWRALLFLAAVLTISVALAIWFGGQDGLARSAPATPTGATAAVNVPPTATPASTPPGAPPSTPTPCSLVQTIGRGLDLGAPFLPIAPTVVGSCQPTTPPAGGEVMIGPWTMHAGDALTVVRWILQLIAWALAALFIAGFTGIVRKT